MQIRRKASITIEASLSFSLVLFILFMMLGPLFILQTSKIIILTVDNQSKFVSYYQMLKENYSEYSDKIDFVRLSKDDLNDELSVSKAQTKDNNEFFEVIKESLYNLTNFAIFAVTLKSKVNSYRVNNNIFDNINLIIPYDVDTFDDKNKTIKYDFMIWFKIPFNFFNVKNPYQRFVSFRRAFVGVDGDRYSMDDTESALKDKVYVAKNHINSYVFHKDRYCTYLKKNTTKISFSDLATYYNHYGKQYSSCDYCCKDVRFSNVTIVYVTQYGNKYHYLSKCPKMTAITTEISLEDAMERGLRLCSKCGAIENDVN